MSKIRLLALDIDGTLVFGSGDAVTPRVREALVQARKAGVEVAIATGRRWRRTRSVVGSLGGGLPAVCQGGALTKCESGSTLMAKTFAPALFQRLGEIFRDHGQTLIAQRDDSDGGADFSIDQSTAWNSWTARYAENNRAHAEVVPDLPGSPRQDALCLVAFGALRDLMAAKRAIEAALPGEAEAVVVAGLRELDGSHCLQVVRSRATKWEGLQPLMERAGLGPGEICAVGDDLNDLSMIRGAGLGVAMGNAVEHVKENADWVTGRNDEDGVAQVVERILSS